MKRLLLLCMLVLAALPEARAQVRRRGEAPWWFTLEQGKNAFYRGDYGGALIAFEDARDERQALFYRMERALVDLLSIPEVRRMGDNLERLEVYIGERNQMDAREALDELFYHVKRSSLGNSAKAALAAFERLRVYPEADYWIGEVYRVEGEVGLALQAYRKAYENRALLESSALTVTLLYRIAAMERLRENYNAMESALLEVLEGDSLWKEDTESFIRRAMTRTLENDGPEQFLLMYRHKNTLTEEAHRLLGQYYYSSGRYERAAEQLLFSFLSVSTTVLDELKRGNYDSRFVTLSSMMADLERRPELRAYLRDVDYYRTTYTLAVSLYALGSRNSARAIWSFLANTPASGEWQGRSRLQLANPSVERPLLAP